MSGEAERIAQYLDQLENRVGQLRNDRARLMLILERVCKIVPKSVEYGDWPELQQAVEAAEMVLSEVKKNP